MTDLIQFTPAKPVTTPAEPDDGTFDTTRTYMEPKLDGVRALAHCTPDGVYLTTRTWNQFQDNVPHLRDHPILNGIGQAGYTILDGELVVPTEGHTLLATMSVVGSNPDTAIRVQQKGQRAQLWVFDMPWLAGEDTRQVPLFLRKRYLQQLFTNDDALRHLPYQRVVGPAQNDLYQQFLTAGHEGAILKDPNGLYGNNGSWWRIKEKVTVDAQVVGWCAGAGKYEGLIGSIRVSVEDTTTGQLREIGRVAPGTDAVRRVLSTWLINRTDKQIRDLTLIVEVEAQEFTPYGRLRHPRVKSWRADKTRPEAVTFA